MLPSTLLADGMGSIFLLGGIAVVVLLPIWWVIAVYNCIRKQQVRAQNAFSQIDVQLKRRCDLIPNLVEIVKGYMAHERSTLEAVVEARAKAASALTAVGGVPTSVGAMSALAGASGALDHAMGRLFGLMEAYPELKANQNALALQEELSSTENRIAFARQGFNDSVMRLNESIVVFPSSLVAKCFGMPTMGMFEADAADRALPSVKLS